MLGAWGTEPTKAGVWDDAVVLDHAELAWMDLQGVLLSGCSALEVVWRFSEAEFRAAFARAVHSLGLAHLGLAPHSLRHAGPSWDRIEHRRSLDEIQHRGRWASSASVQRYERHSRVLAALQDLPERTMAYLQACRMHLSSCVHKGVEPPGLDGCPAALSV